jgi:mono/diheme cytochrome c family protein
MRIRPLVASTRTKLFQERILQAVRSVFMAAAVAASAGLLLIAADLSQADARKLVNPVLFTKRSIDQGHATFQQNCIGCHGENGKAATAIIAAATDLTSPKLYKNGTSDGEIFRSIHDGAGDQMPPFKYQGLSDVEIWQLVSFIHSLWPEPMRPVRQDDKKPKM